MTPRILVTGSEGLIGTALCRRLVPAYELVRFDLRGDRPLDVRSPADLEAAIAGCVGVIHLAAVSRVVWGERDPAACNAINIDATRDVLAIANAQPRRPWVMVASSREVYGHVTVLPVTEDAPLAPVNVYGRSKHRGEELTNAARAAGLATAIVRFSNVYGSIADHVDRVVPAFARAAARGEAMCVEGASATFDFTHIDDVVGAVAALVEQLAGGERALPPIHLVSGIATSLGELAALANRAGGGRSALVAATPRSYDVSQFCGDPSRAARVLGWRASTPIEEGVTRLVAAFG